MPKQLWCSLHFWGALSMPICHPLPACICFGFLFLLPPKMASSLLGWNHVNKLQVTSIRVGTLTVGAITNVTRCARCPLRHVELLSAPAPTLQTKVYDRCAVLKALNAYCSYRRGPVRKPVPGISLFYERIFALRYQYLII